MNTDILYTNEGCIYTAALIALHAKVDYIWQALQTSPSVLTIKQLESTLKHIEDINNIFKTGFSNTVKSISDGKV